MNKKLLVAAVSSVLAAPMAAQAVKYKLSGQLNRAVVYLSDGEGSDFQSVDNGASSTRIRVKGSEDLGNGMTAGINFEWSNTANPSGQALKVNAQDPNGTETENLRHADIWFSGTWGKLSLGKGSSASDGATGSQKSSVWNAGVSSARGTFGGGAAWRVSDNVVTQADITVGSFTLPAGSTLLAAGSTIPDSVSINAEGLTTATSTLTVGDTHGSLDSARINRIRYDTPAIGPLTLKASVAQNDYWDVAAVVDTAVMGGEFEAQGFYASDAKATDGGGGDSRYGGSFAYKFAQGTNFAFSYALRDRADSEVDPDTIYFFLGHDLGNTEVGVGYGISSDFAQLNVGITVNEVEQNISIPVTDVETTIFHVGVNHNFPKANMDVYAGYHLHSLDTDVEVNDIHVVAVGAKVKFD